MKKQNLFLLYLTIFLTLILPILVSFAIKASFSVKLINEPFHAFLEASGAIMAIALSIVIFIMYSTRLSFSRHHKIALGLIVMGVFGAFHSMVHVGALFIWLYSLSVFFGGIFFSFVWIGRLSVTQTRYQAIPTFVFFGSIVFVGIICLFQDSLPLIVDNDGDFTNLGKFLNFFGGFLYILSALYFIKRYFEKLESDDLLYAGHAMLFGVAGIMFFYSSIWDAQWWFWHFIRYTSFIIAMVFLAKIFHKSHSILIENNEKLASLNSKLSSLNKILQEYKKAVDTGTIISISDLEGRIKYVNDEFLTTTGYKKEELIGKPHSILRHPDTPKTVFKELWETIKSKRSWKGLLKNKNKAGENFYVKLTVVPILDENNEIIEYVGLREDVSELVRSQKELKELFYTDPLTRLNNRFKLIEDIKHFSSPMICLLNLSNFKQVNDFYGNEIGDKVLIEYSSLLVEFSHSFKFKLYRNHADEFALICNRHNDEERFYANILAIISKISNTQFNIDSHEIHIGAYAGIAFGKNELLYADLAIKEAKREKKPIVVYNENLNIRQSLHNNLVWTQKIRNALKTDSIKIALQPIMDIQTKSITKYEALVRLIDEDGSIVSPFKFLEIAKQTRLYLEITRRVARQVFEALNETQGQISLNLTAADIVDEETKNYILNLIRNNPNSRRLIIELVESEGIETFESVSDFITQIKENGCKLAIDDFGTGYSNFEYLIKLNADFIKIDGSMIKNIHTDKNAFEVVSTIVDFAKKQSLKVVAEFVSSPEILETVERLKIDYAQGYYIQEPRLWSRK